ncbi:MAG: metallophosphoesterase family protein [Patescibacteria group bacterium]
MFRRKKNKRTPRVNFFRRTVRSLIAIVLLSSLVLGLTYFVKEVSSLDPKKIASFSSPYLSRVGLDEDEVGEVAGKFVQRVSDTGLNKESNERDSLLPPVSTTNSVITEDTASSSTNRTVSADDTKPAVSVAIMSDSENDWQQLSAAISKAKTLNVSAMLFIGDYTSFGEISDLVAAKELMDASSIPYYSIPGDRDLYEAVGQRNFTDVFGKNYHKVNIENTNFILLDNSPNYTPIDNVSMKNFERDVSSADFVLLATPLYHPTNTRVMGVTSDEVTDELVSQREELLSLIRDSDVKAIIAAEHHFYSESTDPQKRELLHYVNGAITKARNLQTPRFSLLKIYQDGSFAVEQVIL